MRRAAWGAACVALGLSLSALGDEPPEALAPALAETAAAALRAEPGGEVVCAFVEAAPGAEALALALARELPLRPGVRLVQDAQAITKAAISHAEDANCFVWLQVSLRDTPRKRTATAQWFSRAPGADPTRSEPFSVELRRYTAGPVALDSWRLQQLSLDGGPWLALSVLDLDGDGELDLAALSREELVVYHFAPRANTKAPLPSPQEVARFSLETKRDAPKKSRDPVGSLLVLPTGGLALRTSDMRRALRLLWRGNALVEEGESPAFPLSANEGTDALWGSLSEGKNYFLPEVRLGSRSLDLGASFYSASLASAPRGPWLALSTNEGASLYAGDPLVAVASPLANTGAQLLLSDLNRDKTPELLAASASASNEADEVSLYRLDASGTSARLWKSGPLYGPAPSGSTARPAASITALAAGDLDGDGAAEMIAALLAGGRASLLVIYQ
jgi:hypothetical protein